MNIRRHLVTRKLPLTYFKSKSLVIDWKKSLIQRTDVSFNAFPLGIGRGSLDIEKDLIIERKARRNKCGDHVKRNRESIKT